MDLVDRLLAGDARALARLISLAEQDDASVAKALSAVQPRTGHSYVIGITGPPGSGKSSLVDAMISAFRRDDKTVGVLAVDPNSPFTGGAVLGDRIRMQRHALDEGVYVRSMGARGHLGGLASATRQATRILDAYGRDYVILETVGVGQAELEVSGISDTVVVVLNPSQGDEVQALKAGILEIADIFVINKADLAGADRAVRQLRQIYPDDMQEGDWLPPILKTVAVKEEGIERLLLEIEKHRAHVEKTGRLEEKRRARLRDEVLDLVSERARRRAAKRLRDGTDVGSRISTAPLSSLDPYELASELLDKSGT
jgi:LAO/AO transport system kinase